MPMYFFDSSNGKDSLADAYGIELVDVSEAIDQAEEIARTLLCEGTLRSGAVEIAVQVRSEAGAVIHTVQGRITSRSAAVAGSSSEATLDEG